MMYDLAKECVPVESCLFVLDTLGVGGSERKIIFVANKLAENGYRVHLAFLNLNTDISDTINSSIGVKNLDRKGKFDIKAVKEIKRYIQNNGIKVIWSVNLYPMIYAYLATRGDPDVRFIGSSNITKFRNNYERLKMFIYVPIIWRLDVFVFGSERQKIEWQRIYPLRKTECVTIHNGVDTRKFSLASMNPQKLLARRQLRLTEHSLVIVMVAQFRVEKAHEDLLSAVKASIDQRRNIQVLLVGGGELEGAIRAMTSDLGISDRVVFAGVLDDVRPALLAADVFALTSWSETFSNAALEAMAMEVPVILSDTGGAGEMVEEGVNGFLYPPGNIRSLVSRIDAMLDAGQRRKMGREARRIVEERFSSESMVKKYSDIIAREAWPR